MPNRTMTAVIIAAAQTLPQCSYCRVHAGYPYRTRSGALTMPHTRRLALVAELAARYRRLSTLPLKI